MKAKRDWFYTVILVLYELIIFLAMADAYHHMGGSKAYPDLIRAKWLIAALLGLGLMILFSCLWGRLEVSRRLKRYSRAVNGVEWAMGAILIAAGIVLRYLFIARYPFTPSGDGQVYFDIAKLLSLGSLTMASPYYCDYISLFPTTMGYARLLSLLFGVTDASAAAARILNLVMQGATLLILWRMARRVAGRIGGLVALAAIAFWPSMIIFSSEIAGEFATTLLMFAALFLIVSQETRPLDQKHSFRHIFLLGFGGICLGLASGMYPLVPVTILALAIYMRRQRRVLPALPSNDIPLGHRVVARGWACFLIVLLTFLATTGILRLTTAYLIDRSPVGPVSSFGYSVMQGLNQGSEGAWNQEDADFLMEKLEETGSATETQMRCYEIAGLRLQLPGASIANLMMRKMDNLLGRDEYSTSLALLHLSEAGQTEGTDVDFFHRAMDWCNFYYLFFLLLAAVGGVMTYTRRQSFAYALMMILSGTVLAYLLLDCQNRYHYVLLPILCVMGGVAVRETLEICTERLLWGKRDKLRAFEAEQQRQREIESVEKQKRELNDLRAKALHAQFDMGKALEEGHIRVIVSKAVADTAESPLKQKAAEGRPASHE